MKTMCPLGYNTMSLWQLMHHVPKKTCALPGITNLPIASW